MGPSRIALCSALVLALYGCGGGSGGGSVGGGTGSFSFGVSDNPADALKVNVAFRQVVLKPTASGAEPTLIDVADPFEEVDLLTVTGSDVASLVASVAVPSGEYQLCVYMLNDETGSAGTSYVETADDGIKGLVTNSNGSCGGELANDPGTGRLFLNKPFTIVSGGSTSLVAEFNLEKGLQPPKGSKDYWTLKPTSVQLVDVEGAGFLEGEVEKTLVESCHTQAGDLGVTQFFERVYLYPDNATLEDPPLAASDKTGVDFRDEELPDVIDTDEVLPVAAALLTDVPGDSTVLAYSFGFLEPGNYSAALTCTAQNDNPDDVDLIGDSEPFFLIGMAQGATVSSGQTSVLDLTD